MSELQPPVQDQTQAERRSFRLNFTPIPERIRAGISRVVDTVLGNKASHQYTEAGVTQRLQELGALPAQPEISVAPIESAPAVESTEKTKKPKRFTSLKKVAKILTRIGALAVIAPTAITGSAPRPIYEHLQNTPELIPVMDTVFRPDVRIASYNDQGRAADIPVNGMLVLGRQDVVNAEQTAVPGVEARYIDKAYYPKDLLPELMAGHDPKKLITDMAPLFNDRINVVAVDMAELQAHLDQLKQRYGIDQNLTIDTNNPIAYQQPPESQGWPFFYTIKPEDYQGLSPEAMEAALAEQYGEDVAWDDELLEFVVGSLQEGDMIYVNNQGSTRRGPEANFGIVFTEREHQMVRDAVNRQPGALTPE